MMFISSTDPELYKRLKFMRFIEGQPLFMKIVDGIPSWAFQEPISDFPNEFDFFNAWCGKDPQNAKEYYRQA